MKSAFANAQKVKNHPTQNPIKWLSNRIEVVL